MRKKGLVVMGLVMALGLSGCGNEKESPATTAATTAAATEAATEAFTETTTEAATETTTEAATEAATEAPATSSDAPTGDGLVSEEELQKGFVWLNKVKPEPFKTTYEELAEYFGVDGAFEKEEYSDKMKVNKRYYKWISTEDENHFIYVNLDEKEPGVYSVSGFNSSGFTSADAEAAYLEEVQGEAKEADKANAANAETAAATYDVSEFGNKDNTVKVTLDQPGSGWAWDEKKTELVASDDINTFGAGFIKFTVNKEVDKFDTYMDKFENYEEVEDRVIGGITMKGRKYDYIGYSWTEYVGQISDGTAIAVGIVDVDIDEGTMGDKILNSVKFE